MYTQPPESTSEWGYPHARHAGLLFSGPAPMLLKLLSGPRRLRQRQVTYTETTSPFFWTIPGISVHEQHVPAQCAQLAMRLFSCIFPPPYSQLEFMFLFIRGGLNKNPTSTALRLFRSSALWWRCQRLGKAPQDPESASCLPRIFVAACPTRTSANQPRICLAASRTTSVPEC